MGKSPRNDRQHRERETEDKKMLNGFNSNYFNFGLNTNPWGSGVNLNFGTSSSMMNPMMPISLGNSLFSSGMSMPMMMNPMMPSIGLGGGIFGSGMPSAFGGGMLSGQVQDPALMKDWQKAYQEDVKSRGETAAQDAYNTAFREESNAIADYNETNEKLESLENEYRSAFREADQLSHEMAVAQDELDKADESGKSAAKSKLDGLKERYEDAKDEVERKKKELNDYKRQARNEKDKIRTAKAAKERVEKEARRLGYNISTSTQEEHEKKYEIKNIGLFGQLTARNDKRQQIVKDNSNDTALGKLNASLNKKYEKDNYTKDTDLFKDSTSAELQ